MLVPCNGGIWKGGRRGCARVYGTGPQKGYQVWPLVTNSFDPDLTYKFLQDPHAQRFIIDQLLKEAETHGFDGINIDFENIYEKIVMPSQASWPICAVNPKRRD